MKKLKVKFTKPINIIREGLTSQFMFIECDCILKSSDRDYMILYIGDEQIEVKTEFINLITVV